MQLTPEEQERYDQMAARCAYVANQLRQLEAPHENLVALEADYEPLLWRPPIPCPPCPMPYHQTELIP